MRISPDAISGLAAFQQLPLSRFADRELSVAKLIYQCGQVRRIGTNRSDECRHDEYGK
jgi:hypothetical protein